MIKKNDKKRGFFGRIIYKLNSINFGLGKDRNYFIENLSMLIESGMPINDAISSISKEVKSKAMKRILENFQEEVSNGSSLWKAFKKTGIFKEYTISLIRIGEETGRLLENLKLIAEQDKKDKEFQSKIKSAMMYPMVVLSVTVLVAISIAWFILPKLSLVFSQLNLDLPAITRGLIATGEFLSEYGNIVIPSLLVFIGLVIYFTFFFSKTKFIGQNILFAIPGIKGLLQEIELARFGYLLGTLLKAGLPIIQALESLAAASKFPHYKKIYIHLQTSIEEGNSFQKSFQSYPKIEKYIPSPIQQLIIVGEKSGNLSNILLSVGASFEAKTANTTKNLSVILEPIMLVIVWVGVVGVALAVILPVYNLIGGLNTQPTQKERYKEENTIIKDEIKVIENAEENT